MKKGFATSAILYTMLLLFILLLVSILNNLQNKKTILDALKKDTIYALQENTVVDTILGQLAKINEDIVSLQNQVNQIKNIPFVDVVTQTQLDSALSIDDIEARTCTRKFVAIRERGLEIGGGVWMVETCVITSQYAYQIAQSYTDSSGIVRQERSLYNGNWTDWLLK